MLKAGDRVRIVAPAYPGDGRLVRGQAILESFGLLVEYGDHVYDQYGYLAGTDADRLADLNAAFRDPVCGASSAPAAATGRSASSTASTSPRCAAIPRCSSASAT